MSRNLLAAMKRQLLSPSKVKGTGRVLKDSSGFRLPAVTKYIVKVQPYNPLLEQIGIKLRLPMKFEAKTNSTERANRYMKGTIYRIRRLIVNNEYEKAGKIVRLNMQFSKAFRASAFNKVLKGGYYNMNYKECGKIHRKIDRLLYENSANLDYKRVYIEKSNGKLRPLGVPSREGRIVLHMLNNFIVELERKYLLTNQHGYVPNRGTMTAGRSVIENISSNYIYETDLKGFFDNVSVGKVIDLVRDQSGEISRGLIQLCKRAPKFGKNKIEKKYKPVVPKINKSDGLNPQALTHKQIVSHVFRYMNGGNSNLENKKSVEGQNFGIIPGGFPQGMPLSPFLSILALKEYLNQSTCVNYADDQIFFSDSQISISDQKDKGIIHSADKCKGIKINGEGIVDSFKFLGFRLSKNYELSSETRQGVKELLNPKIEKLFTKEGLAKLRKVKSENSLMQLGKGLDVIEPLNVNHMESVKNITQRRFFGFIISCMQIGDGENNHSGSDRRKAERTMNNNLNTNSLLGHVPSILDSSKCIPHLGGIITKVIQKNSGRKKHKNKLNVIKS